MRFLLVFVGCVFATGLEAATAGLLDLEKASASVEFLAVGKPSMIQIRGKSTENGAKGWVKGQLKVHSGRVEGEAEVPLVPFETGIKLRDRHMREKYLKTSEFPTARLKLTKFELPVSLESKQRQEGLAFEGMLSVCGVEKPVKGVAEVSRTDNATRIALDFTTSIPEHGIELPSFMGVTVAEKVEVSVWVESPDA